MIAIVIIIIIKYTFPIFVTTVLLLFWLVPRRYTYQNEMMVY